MIFVVYTKENKNIMKKSKIIVPALGILLLSTAASISGTVAWFTASRTFSTSVSEFGVGSIDGQLKATVAAGVGTKVGTNDSTIEFAVDDTPSVLTDASYYSTGRVVYTDDAVVTEAGGGTNTTAFYLVGTDGTRTAANLKAGSKDSKDYYYAVTWTITLKYEGSATSNNVHMLFDSTESSITVTSSSEGTDKHLDIGNGIRFNFEVNSASKVNYAPLRETSGVNNVASATTTQATQQLIASDTTITKLPDNKTATVAATHKEYLGTTAPDENFVVTVTAWLEGTDADVLSSLLDPNMTISGNLNFYCRTEGTDSTAL